MAKFKITPTTTVAELKEQFSNEVGGVLRIYEGRSEAADRATLVSLGAKEGELECRTSRTVGKFEEAFQNDLNLKVKVYTKDNWVKVLDGITLATAAELPNGMTKAKMEEYLSYKREEKEEGAETVNEETTERVEVPDKFKGIPLVDLSFTKLDMTEDEIEENSDELDVPGVIVIYAYDEDGDFEATAWSDGSIYDNLVDGCREWTNQYAGERRLEYYISKQFDKYGFSDDVEEDDINRNIGAAISTYVGDYGSSYSLGSPLLIRAKWENKTDIFTINRDGNFENMWSLEKEFPELIRLTLAGENVKEFPAIPVYKGIFVDINVDDVLTVSPNELIDRIKEDVSWAKYAGTIFFKCTFKDDKEFEICIKEKNAEVAFQQLKDAVKSNGSEIDWSDYAHILIESEGFNPDGTSINPDKTIDMVCQLKMREERFDTLPEWTGSACFFYSVQQRSNRSNYPTLLQYNANGEEVDLDVEMEEIEEKFDLNSEE